MSRILGLVAISCLVWCFVSPRTAPTKQASRVEQESSWVLHAPFDGQPRMVVMALAPHVFVAYDASTCGYYMAWTGGLSFASSSEGIAPLPVRDGEPSGVGISGCPWDVSDQEGAALPIRARYLGCSFEEGDVVLAFELECQGGQIVRIEERPSVLDSAGLDEWWREATGGMGANWPEDMPPAKIMRRSFVVSGLPGGFKLHLRYTRTVASGTSFSGVVPGRAPQGELDPMKYAALRLTFDGSSIAYIDEILDEE